MMAENMLKIDDINVYYGAIHALKGISLEVNKGEIVTLIGANGAGKSTTLRTISGLLKPRTGGITFCGKDIAGMPAHKIVREGISQVPEGRRVFAEMTVRENLDLGAFTRKDKDGIAQDLDMVYDLFPRLKERASQVAGTLSGGEQQQLGLRRQRACDFEAALRAVGQIFRLFLGLVLEVENLQQFVGLGLGLLFLMEVAPEPQHGFN